MPTATQARHRRQLLRNVIVLGAAVLILAVTPGLHRFLARRPSSPMPSVRLNPTETRIVKLVNLARIRAGAAPLASSERLTLAARTHSKDMATHRYLGHDSAAGDSPADRVRAAGLDYQEIAENLLSVPGHEFETLPQQTLSSWLASAQSRNKLLGRQFRIGAVAIAHAADGSYYITLDLMR
jgi:uncharacterized protein YkwD